MRFVFFHLVYLYSSMDTATAWKKTHLILSDKSDFDMIKNLLIEFHAFARHILLSLSADEMLQPRTGPLILVSFQIRLEMALFWRQGDKRKLKYCGLIIAETQ